MDGEYDPRALGPLLEGRQTLRLAEFPLAVLKILGFPGGRATRTAVHADIIELDHDLALGFFIQYAAVGHLDMTGTFRAKNGLRAFNLFHMVRLLTFRPSMGFGKKVHYAPLLSYISSDRPFAGQKPQYKVGQRAGPTSRDGIFPSDRIPENLYPIDA